MKKNSSLKRSLAMGMAVAMVGATLAGCGGSSSAAASSTAESTAGSEAAAEPANAEKPYEGTTLTWYTKLNANVSDNYTNLGETPWAQYVEEKTGIHIEFQHPTQGSENEEFAVMVASGEYPDIIEHTWTSYSGGGGRRTGPTRPGNWSWPAPTQLSCTSIHPALRWQRTAPLPIISCCAIPLS